MTEKLIKRGEVYWVNLSLLSSKEKDKENQKNN
jgi:mRNA-degrading endonuclease toxin of MazEF toxin-antitoxin module